MIAENIAEFDKAGVSKWHEAGYKGKGIRIAVLDSAPLLTEDMVGIPQYHLMGEPSTIAGGHCASVARVIHEVAPEADIYLFSHLSGMKYVSEHPEDFDIANLSMSWHGAYPDLHGVPLCIASGNSSDLDCWDKNMHGLDKIIVGAWEEYMDKRAPYSNGGDYLTCMGYTLIHIPTKHGAIPLALTAQAVQLRSSAVSWLCS